MNNILKHTYTHTHLRIKTAPKKKQKVRVLNTRSKEERFSTSRDLVDAKIKPHRNDDDDGNDEPEELMMVVLMTTTMPILFRTTTKGDRLNTEYYTETKQKQKRLSSVVRSELSKI